MIRLKIRNLRLHSIGPLDLAVEASECVSISGVSGAGKTLMLRAIADLEPHQGSIYLDEAKASEIIPSEWRRKVGMLPAESRWWHDKVSDHFKAINEPWLEMLGLDKSVVGWQVNRLSSGERQRLGLLRLLCNRPKVLLLDEPTANLDPENMDRVETLLEKYRIQQKAAVIWVTHNPDQIRRVSSRSFLLDDGSISEKN